MVGHQPRDVAAGSTLKSVYLEPLEQSLDARNASRGMHESRVGIYDTNIYTELVLTIEIVSCPVPDCTDFSSQKENGEGSWSSLVDKFQPLVDKGYLTMYDTNTS